MDATVRATGRSLASLATRSLLLLLPPLGLGWAAAAAGSLATIGPQQRWWTALLLWIVAGSASTALALQHLGRIRVPGCAEGGACAQLTNGQWGKIFGWPVSFFGTAWFAALGVFQAATWNQPLAGLFALGLTIAALGSLFFLGLIVVTRHACPYCLMVHSANLTAWLLFVTVPERVWWPSNRQVGAAVAAAATFCGVSVLLAATRKRIKRISAQRRERLFQQSLRRIHRHLYHSHEHQQRAPVSGRWWRGLPTAPVRLVIFADYQCSDCRQAESQLDAALPGRCYLAVTYKHFPLSHACNRRVQSGADHRHACRAALAAETAGLLGGPPGFLRFHTWLFQHGAAFTDAELAGALPGLGFADPAVFFQAMDGPQAAEHLRQDIEEAIGLGVAGTPAVFVEGVRLEGATAERAISRLVESLDGVQTREVPPPWSPKEHGRQTSYRP